MAPKGMPMILPVVLLFGAFCANGAKYEGPRSELGKHEIKYTNIPIL